MYRCRYPVLWVPNDVPLSKGVSDVQDFVPLFRKGSLIPSVLDVEADLIELEREAREEVDRILARSRQAAEQLLLKTRKELPHIEEAERQELIVSLTTSAEDLLLDRERELTELRERIATKRKQALDRILARIIPGWERPDANNRK
jgi:hypothetical protein